MTPDRFRDALNRLGLSTPEAAKFLRVQERSVFRWLAGNPPVPFAVAALLIIMLEVEVTPREVVAFVAANDNKRRRVTLP